MSSNLYKGEVYESFSKNNDKELFDDEKINQKYIKGDTRLVTEQARYPLPSLLNLFDTQSYILQPDFQRRKRWDVEKKSKLIESFIINVPVPPVFLYEISYANYEVMDGLQRITAIIEFYTDQYPLTNLEQWPELNGKRYSELPEKVRDGIDRRYISSIILLNESASNADKADEMKRLVFERLNTGGVKLSYQEIRNAIYNGHMNQLCISLSTSNLFRKLWNIVDEENSGISENKLYKDMSDVELVLRFFAMRFVDKYNGNLRTFLDEYLINANKYPRETLESLSQLFENVYNIAYSLFDINAFRQYGVFYGKEGWSNEAQRTVYDPMILAIMELDIKDEELNAIYKEKSIEKLKCFVGITLRQQKIKPANSCI